MKAIQVQKGKQANEPTAPVRSGYTLGGWYTDAAGTKAYDWSNPVVANLTLYAKWQTATPEVVLPEVVVANPIDGELRLLNAERVVRYTVYTQTGVAIVQGRSAGAEAIRMDATDWPSGGYLVRVEGTMGGRTIRVVKL